MNVLSVVLDTNVIVSAIVFGGKPRSIVDLVVKKELRAISSPLLLAELGDVLHKKFRVSELEANKIERQIRKNFVMVYPTTAIHVLTDEPDNRVLEAGIAGKSNYIITGDKELLKLKRYKKIEIRTPGEFLDLRKE